MKIKIKKVTITSWHNQQVCLSKALLTNLALSFLNSKLIVNRNTKCGCFIVMILVFWVFFLCKEKHWSWYPFKCLISVIKNHNSTCKDKRTKASLVMFFFLNSDSAVYCYLSLSFWMKHYKVGFLVFCIRELFLIGEKEKSFKRRNNSVNVKLKGLENQFWFRPRLHLNCNDLGFLYSVAWYVRCWAKMPQTMW